MNIVCVLGSPRIKGNSAAIAATFVEKAESLGADITVFTLNKLKYKGCQACYTCKTKLDRCVVNDDLTAVLDAIRDCDVLVMASPVYYGEVSSQLKGFIDRTFSFLVPDFQNTPNPSRIAPGKKLLFIITQGESDERMYNDIIPRYTTFFGYYGFIPEPPIRICGVYDKGDAAQREDLLQTVRESAEKIVSGK